MVVGPELARDLSNLSLEIGRQIGLLVDRAGNVTLVAVGDGRGLVLPEMGRGRGALTRLSGLRLIHTHLAGEGLSQDDINDLASLRLDLIAALIAVEDNLPPALEAAYLLPSESEDGGKHGLSQSPARRGPGPGFFGLYPGPGRRVCPATVQSQGSRGEGTGLFW